MQSANDHNKWFLAQVEEGIKEADDPNTVMVPHAVVKKDMAQQRKKLADLIAQCDLTAPHPKDMKAWNDMRSVGKEIISEGDKG